eukprot:scaffold360497_cov24-Attheya_sp.AAC.1
MQWYTVASIFKSAALRSAPKSDAMTQTCARWRSKGPAYLPILTIVIPEVASDMFLRTTVL